MIQNPVESSSWFRALPLEQRIRTLHDSPISTAEHGKDSAAHKYAQHRLNRWESETLSKEDQALFPRFLEILGVSQATFFSLLAESDEQMKERLGELPGWVLDIQKAYAPSEAKHFETESIPQLQPGEEPNLFTFVLKPLFHFYAKRIKSSIENLQSTYPYVPLNTTHLINLLLQNEPYVLSNMLYRTMILELNAARMQGLLQGSTQAERFSSFLERLRRPEVAVQLFEEYPALARQTALYIQQWADASIEFLGRLCRDWQDIQNSFDQGNLLGAVVNLSLNQGDRHHNGRTVIIAKFESGLRLVYKPRSIAVDAHFQELLNWLNQRGASPEFRTLTILSRTDYGWIEYVTPTGCKSPQEVERFYQRQGAYLALLHVLSATDFHYENLLAAGEHPVLIDLEALFHSPPRQYKEDQLDPNRHKIVDQSVLHVGLLPDPISAEIHTPSLNSNGLGSLTGQLTRHRFPIWENSGTDEMRIVRKYLEVETPDHNLPTLEGKAIDVNVYRTEILRGFTHMYRLLAQHKEELLADEGPIKRFAGDSTRIILRASQVYGRLLQESYHPDYLRDCLDRDRLFSRLWRMAITDPRYQQVAAAEIADLHQNDIPLFASRTDSRHIWTSTGEQISDFFAEPCMDQVCRRITQLSEKDLVQQKWFVEMSLMTFVKNSDIASPPPIDIQGADEYSPEEYLQAARQIGDRLETLAYTTDDGALWLTVNFSDVYLNGIATVGATLYDGLCGISLFLAYLGEMTGETRYTRLAKQAINTTRRYLAAAPSDIEAIGAYSGWGGMIYTFVHLAALWNDPQLIREAEGIVPRLLALIPQDPYFDLIAGSAGCLTALLVLHEAHPSRETLAAARLCGEQLLAHAVPFENGIGWKTIPDQEECLTGFSHGTAGIAWALLKLAAASGEEKYRTAAWQAIQYERHQFIPEQKNWRNLFKLAVGSADQPDFTSVKWCHGAPGIGLSRLSMLDEPYAHEEIRVAIETTLAEGFGLGQCLCHGDLGNLDLILQASERLNDRHLKQQAYAASSSILKHMQVHGWYCGVPMGIEVPGLMTGIAGIGYGLLRLANPQRIPSVLTLDAPITTRYSILKARQ